jgi:predicted DNA-binding transcriptional regulator YafY
MGGKLYSKVQPVLHKIQRHIESPFYTRIDVEDISDTMDLIEDLEYAISKQKMITFEYKRWWKPNEIKTHEEVKPYKIVIFNGFWYLIAQKRDFTMHLYLKEIHNLKILDKTFKLEDNIINRLEKAHNIYFDSRKEPFEVILLLQSNAIVYFERKPLNGQYLKKNSDGTAELTISATNKEEIFPILKRWLPQIKVIEPPELQEEFEEMMKKYLNY